MQRTYKTDNILLKKDAFKGLCLEVLPNIQKISEALERYGIAPECLASLTMSTDGYMVFSTHANRWEMIRLPGDQGVKLRYELAEYIELGEVQ